MDMLKITGGRTLHGRIKIDGAKNSALPIMASSLAVTGTSVLKAIPELVDVNTMTSLLQELSVTVDKRELMRRMRAGICVLGPLLARFGKAVVSLPGGCNIGHRPVDLHLKGLTALGEAATFAIAAAATRSQIVLSGCQAAHMTAVLGTLRSMGVQIQIDRENGTDDISIDGRGPLTVLDITATPYPGLPTDTQAQLMALQTTISGSSRIRDTVFPDRFLHASELMRMGASIVHDGTDMIVHGGERLSGAHVMASDLRASAALVIAALAAEGESVIHRIYHLDRGYCRLEDKLSSLNASVIRERES
ncbi:UNVERIFIED_CONTAM: hypothetical protein GTU68_053197 [Idotea baltica]|nr:hypothetical protein [Idotea baltica]